MKEMNDNIEAVITELAGLMQRYTHKTVLDGTVEDYKNYALKDILSLTIRELEKLKLLK